MIAAVASLLQIPTASASTDYLGPWSNPGATYFSASQDAKVAVKFTVTSTQTITYATAQVSVDPALNPAAILEIYPSAGAGTANWAPLTTFTQSGYGAGNFTPPPFRRAYRVTFTGSVTLTPGEYFATVYYPSGALNTNVWGGDGTQSSAWSWGPVDGNNEYPYYYLANGLWSAYATSGAPTITLADAPPPAPPADQGADQTPASVLQQVPLPASGRCEDVLDDHLRWETTLTGGWGRSWAAWANGPVCTRTFVHVNARWQLG